MSDELRKAMFRVLEDDEQRRAMEQDAKREQSYQAKADAEDALRERGVRALERLVSEIEGLRFELGQLRTLGIPKR